MLRSVQAIVNVGRLLLAAVQHLRTMRQLADRLFEKAKAARIEFFRCQRERLRRLAHANQELSPRAALDHFNLKAK